MADSSSGMAYPSAGELKGGGGGGGSSMSEEDESEVSSDSVVSSARVRLNSLRGQTKAAIMAMI